MAVAVSAAWIKVEPKSYAAEIVELRVVDVRRTICGWTYKQQAVGFWSARCLSKLARTFRECGLVLTVDDALCECDALGEMMLESENLASACYTNSAVALEELV